MLSDEEFRKILDFFDRSWEGYRKIRRGVKKRLWRHMEEINCHTVDAYLKAMAIRTELRAACEEELSVTISRFFRDLQVWEYLQKSFLPELIHRFPGGLNAWSAGCASGEEPYTLSIVWESLKNSTASFFKDLDILATDINAFNLQRAKEGIYPGSSLKEVPESARQRWFKKLPSSKLWKIDPYLQKRICWQSHQLLDKPPRDIFHLILLRNNLLTYYQGNRLKAAFDEVLNVLAPGGILVTGTREQLPQTNQSLKQDVSLPWVYHKGSA